MAYGSFASALTAIREALDDGAGNLRTVAASRFTDDLVEASHESELQRRGIRSDKPFRARILRMTRNGSSPPINGSVILYDFDVEVTVSRTIATLEQVSSDAWATLEALGWEDADAIRQVLCTPPNLETTSLSVSTNIVGDALRYTGSRGRLVPVKGAGAQRYETIHEFAGILKVSPATM